VHDAAVDAMLICCRPFCRSAPLQTHQHRPSPNHLSFPSPPSSPPHTPTKQPFNSDNATSNNNNLPLLLLVLLLLVEFLLLA